MEPETGVPIGLSSRARSSPEPLAPPCVPQGRGRCPAGPRVWLSPPATIMPGSARPCSGATTCSIPWRGSSTSKISMPKSRAFSAKYSTCRAAPASGIERVRTGDVGLTCRPPSARQKGSRPAARDAQLRLLSTQTRRTASSAPRVVKGGDPCAIAERRRAWWRCAYQARSPCTHI